MNWNRSGGCWVATFCRWRGGSAVPRHRSQRNGSGASNTILGQLQLRPLLRLLSYKMEATTRLTQGGIEIVIVQNVPENPQRF